MAIPRFEALSGVVNGTNTTFSTSVAYTAGTLAIFLNGQLLKNPAGDPWTEISPLLGTVDIAVDCTPRTGDHVAGFFVDTLESFVGSEVTPIYGSITELGNISARLVQNLTLFGSIEETQRVCGILTSNSNRGVIREIISLSGTIEVC